MLAYMNYQSASLGAQTTTRKQAKTQPWQAAIGIILAIAASQALLFWQPVVGVYLNAAVFALLVTLALRQERLRPLAISAAVLPTSTMIAASIPASSLPARIAALYGGLFVLGFAYRLLFGLTQKAKPSKNTWPNYLNSVAIMCIVGAAIGAVSFGLLRHTFIIHNLSALYVAVAAAAAVGMAIIEEFFFRGVLQDQAARLMRPSLAAVFGAIFYTLCFFNHISPLLAVAGALIGLATSWVYAIRPSLALTTTLNVIAKLTFLALLVAFVA